MNMAMKPLGALFFLLALAGTAYAGGPEPTDNERANSAQYSPEELCLSGIAGLKIATDLTKTTPAQAKEKYEYAAKMFLLAAERGHGLAQQNLGFLYYDGVGVKRSFELSLYWFRKAANQGLSPSQSQVGLMYETGIGLRQDFEEAARWYQLAAFQHYSPAQERLGILYATGKGVPKDLIFAHMWLNLAAATGNAKATEARDAVGSLLTPKQVAEAQTMAREWIKQHPSKCVADGSCLPLSF